MNPTLVIGSLDTDYGPLSIAVVVGDHSNVSGLARAASVGSSATSSEPVVVASGWIDIDVLLRYVDESIVALPRTYGELPTSLVSAVQAWNAGDGAALDHIAVAQSGGEFRQHAWTALRTVPGGTVVTYSELAGLAGNSKASRAAGSACATNNVAPFVPCHRVVQVAVVWATTPTDLI